MQISLFLKISFNLLLSIEFSSIMFNQPAFAVKPVDTTGAGDCFFGYFLAGIAVGEGVEATLRVASAAA